MKEILKRLKISQDDNSNKLTDFEGILDSQSPHTFFVGCCDSRVLPTRILGGGPGDIFVMKNIANMVPPLNQSSQNCSTVAALEYAVLELEVKNIVVCGHSNCGGCAALNVSQDDLSLMPNLYNWLSLSQDSLLNSGDLSSAELIEKENIIQQLRHLRSYPYVIESVEKGDINLLGIYYHLGKGTIEVFDQKKEKFFLLDDIYEK